MFGQHHLQERRRNKAPTHEYNPASTHEEVDAEVDTSSNTYAGHSPHRPVIGTYAVGLSSHRAGRDAKRETTESANTTGPATPAEDPSVVASDFDNLALSRTSSVYTLGRTSFAAQLNQLTTLDLPDPDNLSATISAIPTAQAARVSLSKAAPQIRHWIQFAAKILGGLNAEDDVEWASNGKDSVADVDAAIQKFSALVNIFVEAIEQLQKRPDIGTVPEHQVKDVVATLEGVLVPWSEVQSSMAAVKNQVALALEWEEIWNDDIGNISNELTALARMVFTMEEDRHNNLLQDSEDVVEFSPLQTIAEDIPEGHRSISRDTSPAPPRVAIDIVSPKIKDASEDSGLVALFANMQPVHTSLEFLPIKLASFKERAVGIFPSAVDELYEKVASLEERWAKLETDAETLRAELNEDRWVVIFRNAGRQASKMCQSLERGIVKLHESLDISSNISTPDSSLAKKIADYKSKKSSYAPAIGKIISVVDKGVDERKTVNGEVLKIQQDIRHVWTALEAEIRDLDAILEARSGGQLRDSVSTIGTQATSEGAYATPGTSPATSIIHTSSRSAVSSLPVRSRYLNTPMTPSSRAQTPSSSTPRIRLNTPQSAPTDTRPRWSGSTVVDYSRFGPHRAPESRLRRTSMATSAASPSIRAPSVRDGSASPSPSTGSLYVPRIRQYTPGPASVSGGRRAITLSTLDSIPKGDESGRASRANRRTSMLPVPKDESKPRWRP